MKIKKKKILKPLVKLYLLKNQFYKQTNKFKCLNKTMLQLKQSLKIIYLYKIKKKKILFLGFPNNKFIQNQINCVFSSKNLYLKNKLNYKQFDLIVFNKTNSKDIILLKQLRKINIPLVIFGDILNEEYCFNFSSKKNFIKNFNIFIIFSILTKQLKK